MEKNLEATSFDSNLASKDTEVDALIAGALKELGNSPKEEKKGETPLKATPMAPIEQIQTQKPKEEAAKMPTETEKAYEDTFRDIKAGAIVTGTIAKIDTSGVLVDIGYKSEGWFPTDEISATTKEGDKVLVMVEKLEDKEGRVVLSKRKAEFEKKWNDAYEAYKRKASINVKVTGAVKGGLVVDLGGVRGFIPASQVSKAPEETLESFVGKEINAKVIEINRRQSKLILSHRFGRVEKERPDTSKLLNELEVGQVRRGIVKGIKTFGAFVDLGGIEGLIPISEMSWKRIRNANDILKSGQEIDVFVLGIDRTNGKISLGLKQLQQDPWAAASEKYKPGQIVKVKVLRLAKFGAFAEIEEGLEALIHISELSKDKIMSPEEAVKPGDIVEAKILRIMPDEQRIGLSIKEVQLAKEKTLVEEQKKEESKVTIAEMLAQKEKEKAERVAEFSEEPNEIPPAA